MEQMKNKFIQNIDNIYSQIVSLEKEINEGYSKIDLKDKFDKMNIGGKMLNLSNLNTELFKTIDLFFSIAEGSIEELSESVQIYYNQIQELKKPLSDTDPEEIKKMKEFINNMSKANGN